ncbi:MAG: Cell envelope-related transcriptional attenuator [Candidatus Beckwithbacteria bacterium GW2011_GWA2_43_10]|uniref:Cell envelope-related transcriptional attenuator n=1 Tax=Candidatus Beckwithbacteria bacterium GW2011_GWA2_43_10 TaxID=1618369 RepID=A0A0G1C480_9BACT|nr:MAG: Cell envelope-related transcriptional attenuator [Candidatus Beckwithbacteria bacterium GW2011_GWA2_43_10]
MIKFKHRIYKYLLFFRPLIYLLIIGAVLLSLVFLVPKLASAFKSALSLINPDITVLESFRDRTNVLLLGIGGGTHAGADLTDSIMLISVNLSTADTVLISLPRDIWVESLSAKLNTAYHFGESKQPGGGLVLAKAAASEIINQPVHYAALLDFSGFETAIDIIGGLDLNVPHGFIDKKYPISGQETAAVEADRYEVLQFSPGPQHLDGPTALKYVRSRYAEGEEGSDYARAQRQQLVLLAFKDKILSSRILLNPAKLKALIKTFKTAVKTDLPPNTYPDLLKLSLRIKSAGLRTGIIDQGSSSEEIPSLLYNPPANLYGQWVLLPINHNWQAVYDHVAEILYQNQ